MNVANKELCKELHELSGWRPANAAYETINGKAAYPRYDLGYLLRKLPPNYELVLDEAANRSRGYWFNNFLTEVAATQIEDNPEDAAAKLAVELLKSGVLTSEHGGSK